MVKNAKTPAPPGAPNILSPSTKENRSMKKTSAKASLSVQGTEITVIQHDEQHYISLTDMLKAKDGDFFISDWLRNRNTVEFLGVWETVHNPNFNSGEFAIIKSQAGLNPKF
jgi:hypothetical protein